MIEELIAKLEQAQGPDRELDAEIALQCGIIRDRDGNCFYGHKDYSVMVLERDYYDIEGGAPELPHYTSSIDAAMTLVPGNWGFQIMPMMTVLKHPRSMVYYSELDIEAFSKFPAMSICIAALKARQCKNPIAT